jgi:hypothetical protein
LWLRVRLSAALRDHRCLKEMITPYPVNNLQANIR